MGRYQEIKATKRSIKLKKNNYGETVAVENEKNKNVPWKKPKKAETVQIKAEKSIKTPKHPCERKKFLEQQMEKKNSKTVLS